MNIAVCIKQVPNTNIVKIDPSTGTLIREGIPVIINPDDKNALEEALLLKERFGARVTAITMGPSQAEEALREALAMGCDDAVLISDRAFAGADTLATSLTLAKAIEKLGRFDIIMCGFQAIDGDTAQVGPQIAEHLNIPQITYVTDLKIEGDRVTAHRAIEGGYQVIQSKLPLLITALKELNNPRYPSAKGIFECFNRPITKLTMEDLNIDLQRVGLKGSPTQVLKSFTPNSQRSATVIKSRGKDAVLELLSELRSKQLLGEVR
jgi:electron transfer flavoprotein beta subunit